MENNYGWIELVFFYGVAFAFIGWQYFSVSRELKRTRAKRLAEEARAQETDEEPSQKSRDKT